MPEAEHCGIALNSLSAAVFLSLVFIILTHIVLTQSFVKALTDSSTVKFNKAYLYFY